MHAHRQSSNCPSTYSRQYLKLCTLDCRSAPPRTKTTRQKRRGIITDGRQQGSARREQSGDVRLRPRLPPEFADPNPSKPHHSHDYRKLALLRLITESTTISKGLISHLVTYYLIYKVMDFNIPSIEI